MAERDHVPQGNRGRTTEDGIDRLERAMRALIDRYTLLRREHGALQRTLAERDTRLRTMDARLRELNQARQDAVKRIDDLVSQLERVEEQLDRRHGAHVEGS